MKKILSSQKKINEKNRNLQNVNFANLSLNSKKKSFANVEKEIDETK